MKWKTSAAAAVCALMLLLATGCGGSQGAASSPPPSSGTGTQAASPPQTSQAPPSSAANPPEETAPSATDPASPSPEETPEEAEVRRTIQAMTLEEKVGQMLLAGVQGTKVDAAAKRMIAEDHVGGIILFKNNLSGGLRSSAELLNGLKAANRSNPVPLFLSVDQEGGRVSRLPKDFEPMPANAAVGKTGDAALAEEMGSLIARQLRLLGFNVDFAPVLDTFSNPDNTVIGDRSFGSKPELVAELGAAEMKGIRDGGILPVVKHFPGHGDTAVDSHKDLPIVRKSEAELLKLELKPFQHAIESGAEAVMVAHILFPELDPDMPASLSEPIITGLLRGKLGYGGVVITDDLAMGAIAKNYGASEAAIRSVEAGGDILLMAHSYDIAHQIYEALLGSVRDGRIPESRVDESVARILKLKFAYGMTDEEVPIPSKADIPNDEIRQWRKQVEAQQ